jgi:hypothetical protein
MQSVVYLLESAGYHKIGLTINLKNRLKQLSTGIPHAIRVVHTIPTENTVVLENYWHRRFRKQRTKGEWFKLSEEDVREFCDYVSSPEAGGQAGGQADGQSTLTALIAEKDARIDDLRGQLDAATTRENAARLQIEAANRATAEAHAALREALKMSARALMEPGQSTLTHAPSEAAEVASESRQSTLSAIEPPKYFERSRGLRGWLLKILKG